MKNFIKITVGVILFFSYSCKSSEKLLNNDKTWNNKMYEIKKIKEEKSLYIIYAIRNDSLFKILTEKICPEITYCNKIKRGKSYNLDLHITFPTKTILGKTVTGDFYSRVVGLSYKEDIIKPEKKSHNTLYIADNLKCLCIDN
ncbi:MAG: hypothetical protein LBQ60_06735 [Bacteroidales bacterium]|jgi:hypothetical protein|nr:hypothetical protein [Bacteroidales bacterium]